MTHEEAKAEREKAIAERNRIVQLMHTFCRGETMLGKGCASCPVEHLNVCNDFGTKGRIDLTNLKIAEETILKIIGKDKNNDSV